MRFKNDRMRLEKELAHVRKLNRNCGEYKLIEIAAARLGWLASYAFTLLNSPFVPLSTPRFVSRPRAKKK